MAYIFGATRFAGSTQETLTFDHLKIEICETQERALEALKGWAERHLTREELSEVGEITFGSINKLPDVAAKYIDGVGAPEAESEYLSAIGIVPATEATAKDIQLFITEAFNQDNWERLDEDMMQFVDEIQSLGGRYEAWTLSYDADCKIVEDQESEPEPGF